ncbi:hypothetical protein [Brachybacterium sp. GPGPB12]|uniref:hypothetical protein n=1 Tax=Brachybacterium sp. GPGPB12 TaxID=3023517 RepID=UPI00313439F7
MESAKITTGEHDVMPLTRGVGVDDVHSFVVGVVAALPQVKSVETVLVLDEVFDRGRLAAAGSGRSPAGGGRARPAALHPHQSGPAQQASTDAQAADGLSTRSDLQADALVGRAVLRKLLDQRDLAVALFDSAGRLPARHAAIGDQLMGEGDRELRAGQPPDEAALRHGVPGVAAPHQFALLVVDETGGRGRVHDGSGGRDHVEDEAVEGEGGGGWHGVSMAH